MKIVKIIKKLNKNKFQPNEIDDGAHVITLLDLSTFLMLELLISTFI